MRKTSLDLRREIIDVGGIQNLIHLRKKRKQKKREALAASQEPPPEPEEIVRVLGRTPVWAGGAGGWGNGSDHSGAASKDCIRSPQTGPVDAETFLKAAVQGQVKVIEKFLADGGSPDTCDQVMFPSGPAPVPASLSELTHPPRPLVDSLRTGVGVLWEGAPQKMWDVLFPTQEFF